MPARLRDALNKGWAAPRFVPPTRFALDPVVLDLDQRFGGVPVDLSGTAMLLDEVERLLISQGGDLGPLTRRQRKAIPHLLWSSPKGWSEHEGLVGDYLAWADRDWRRAPRWLWKHYVLNMAPRSVATRRLGPWLAAKADRLPPALRDFSRNWALFEPLRGIGKVAESLLAGGGFIGDLAGLGIGEDDTRRSAFLLSVLEALGQQLRGYRQACEIAVTLKALLGPLGEQPTAKMRGAQDLRQGALKSLVEGLVLWADRLGEPWIGQALDLLHSLIGDPRLHAGRWQGIDPGVRGAVEGWLTKVTLDAFFRFMREVPTDRTDMVESRVAYWRSYERSISRAWLLVGRHAEAKARKVLDQSFATFAAGANVQADHLGLLIQIGGMVILEMNKTGSTLFWPVADPEMPGFFERTYSRSRLMDACPSGPYPGVQRFRMSHLPSWQHNYKNVIGQRTGIWPSR